MKKTKSDMRYLLLIIVCTGCVSYIHKPYIKETITTKDGKITVREVSADYIKNGSVHGIVEKLDAKP